MGTQYAIGKVKGAEPETFAIIGIDFAEGALKSTVFLSEQELRSELAKQGLTPSQVDAEVAVARTKLA